MAFEGLAQSIIGTLERGQIRRENEMMRKRAERRQRTAQLGQLAGAIGGGIAQSLTKRRNEFQLSNARNHLVKEVYGKEFIGTQGNKEVNPYFKEAQESYLLQKVDQARELMHQKATKPEGFYTNKTKYVDFHTKKDVLMTPAKRLRQLQRDINSIAGPNSGLAAIWQQQQVREKKLDEVFFTRQKLAAKGVKPGKTVKVPGLGDLPFDDYLRWLEHQRKVKADEAKEKAKALGGVETELKRPATIPTPEKAMANYEKFVIQNAVNPAAASHMRALPQSRKAKVDARVIKKAWGDVANKYIYQKNKINKDSKSNAESLARKMLLLIRMSEEMENPEKLNDLIAEPLAQTTMGSFGTNPQNWSTGETGVRTAQEMMKTVMLARMKGQGLLKESTENAMDYMEPIIDKYIRILRREHRGAKIGNIYDWDPDSADIKGEIAKKFSDNKNFRALIPPPASYGKSNVRLAIRSVLDNPESDPERFWGLVLYARAQGYITDDPRLKNKKDTRFGGWNSDYIKQGIEEAIIGDEGTLGVKYQQHFPSVKKAWKKDLSRKIKEADEEAKKRR